MVSTAKFVQELIVINLIETIKAVSKANKLPPWVSVVKIAVFFKTLWISEELLPNSPLIL